MTHREIQELRKLGDKLIDGFKQKPNNAQHIIHILERTVHILSNPIITSPVFCSATDSNKGMIDALMGNSTSANSNNSEENSDHLPLSTETLRIAARLGNFDWKTSGVWNSIKNHFNCAISHSELKKLGLQLAEDAHLIPDRDAKRRKSVMVKWMEDNWAKLSPFLHLYSYDGKAIHRASEL